MAITDLVWLDLETTGLNEHKEKILEVAVSIAPFADPFNARPVYHACILFPPLIVQDLDPYVREMHTKNGLLADCHAIGAKQLADVEDDLLRVVKKVDKRDDMPVLAGSSVHFDHDFLKVHMPRFAARFSHRHYDVSAFKLAAMSYGHEPWPKAEAHRAKDDIVESIKHGREALDWLAGVTLAEG